MLTIPELLDRWILKNLANYPDIYHVSIKNKTLEFVFEYHSELLSQNQIPRKHLIYIALNFIH